MPPRSNKFVEKISDDIIQENTKKHVGLFPASCNVCPNGHQTQFMVKNGQNCPSFYKPHNPPVQAMEASDKICKRQVNF